MDILSVALAGMIIGALGKFVAPGRNLIPIRLTAFCGVVGGVLGWLLFAVFVGADDVGIYWARWIAAIGVAVVFVALASAVTGRHKSTLL